MSAMLLLLSGLALLGGAVAWWIRRRMPKPVPQRPAPAISGEDGLMALRICEAALESARIGMPVKL